MLFNSFSFCIFFPLVTLGYFLLPHAYRWAFLLLASCVFYMWFIPKYILILAATIVIDYAAGIWIERTQGRTRQLILWASILSTCAILALFKYFAFLNTNITHLASLIGWNYSIATLEFILPIGLSFHTFQSLSYVIEVYRGHQRAEKHFGIYALYVMFYPQLVAGPIERPQNLLHQFHRPHSFSEARASSGIRQMGWGLFKKVVIADRLGLLVNQVYNNSEMYPGPVLALATLFFAFQIYCDFSGYSDIAIGAARVMGFDLMTNFDRPYFSKTVSEFWRRWHISLSTWFKDYLYVSLGGNRKGIWITQMNLMLTFLVSGLWHGASWTFVIWGGLNGFYLITSNFLRPIRPRISEKIGFNHFPSVMITVQTLTTFILICSTWVFFRADSVQQGVRIFGKMTSGWLNFASYSPKHWESTFTSLPLKEVALSLGLILLLQILEGLQGLPKLRVSIVTQPVWLRWAFYYGLVLTLIFLGVYGENQFIYFQF